MTKEQSPNYLFIPQPFASGDDNVEASRSEIKRSTSAGDLNFVEGFSSVYGTPASQGGKYPTRGDFNAIGYLASVNEYARACGQIITFNAALAEKIGGYYQGSVLEVIEGNTYHRVISLVDNNMIDFTDPEVGVDGINWAYCDNGTIEDCVLATVPNCDRTIEEGINECYDMLGIVRATKSGYIQVSGNITMSIKEEASAGNCGVGIYVIEGTTAADCFDNVNPQNIPSGYDIQCIYLNGNGGRLSSNFTPKGMHAEAGKYYAVFMLNSLAKIENSSMSVIIK